MSSSSARRAACTAATGSAPRGEPPVQHRHRPLRRRDGDRVRHPDRDRHPGLGQPLRQARLAGILHRRLAGVQHRHRHPVLGQQRRDPSAGDRPAFPSCAVSKNKNPRRPRTAPPRPGEQQPPRRRACLQRGVLAERAVQVEMDDLVPARPVPLRRRAQVLPQRLPGPRPHQVDRDRHARRAATPPAAAGTPSGTPHPAARPAAPSPPGCSASAAPGGGSNFDGSAHPPGDRQPYRQRPVQVRVPQRLPVQPVQPRRPAHLHPAPVKRPVPQPPVIMTRRPAEHLPEQRLPVLGERRTASGSRS